MVLNRVLVVAHDPEHPFYDADWCGRDVSHHDCYFEPISSCTMADVAARIGQSMAFNFSTLPEIKHLKDDLPEAVAVQYRNYPEESQFHPPIFAPFLEASPIDPEKYRYWWRAQTVAYIVRPNKRSLERIRERKLATYPMGNISRGTISVHVRHGDKWTEMPNAVPDDGAFSKAVEELYADAGQAWRLKRAIFLSTEDPESIEHFQGLQSWDVSFTHVPRKPDRTKSTILYAKEYGPANEVFDSLVNLDLALDCDAWIGTLTSNWCRLIDELRATVRCKAHMVYWDAQQPNPPKHIDW